MRATRSAKLACSLVLVPAFLLAREAAQAESRASKQKTRTVSLYLAVEQGDKLIRGLHAENFRLWEEGQSRTFQLAEPETPAAIVLLVEHSQASWMYLNDIASALNGFMAAAPEGHWYALVTFAHTTEVRVDFTKMKGKIAAAFADLGQPIWGEIDTYDAIYETLAKMDRLPGRRVLIVIGSGLDTFSSHNLDDVQKQIEAANVVIFGLGAGSMLRGQYEPYIGTSARLQLLQAEAFLNMLASKSGGEAWFPRFEQAFPDAMRGVMQILDSQYRLIYESRLPADAKFHKIKVEAFTLSGDKRTDYQVRVREGWRVW